MITVRRLYDLQGVDLEIAKRDASLTEVRAKLADDSGITSTRQKIAQVENRLADLGSRRRAAERTVAGLQDNLKRIEARLYGGAVKNLRELEAAEEERGSMTSQKQEQEDVLLEVMVEADEAEALLRELQDVLKRIEAARPQEIAELTRSEGELVSELTILRAERDRTAPEIPPDLYALYESLRRSKNGHAVSRVERGMCQGCRRSLSTMELQRARTSRSGVVQCGSCRMILYVP